MSFLMNVEILSLYLSTVAINYLLMNYLDVRPVYYSNTIAVISLVGTVIIIYLALIKFIKG